MSENIFDKERLREEYEDSLFRLAMAGYAREFGKSLSGEESGDFPERASSEKIGKAIYKTLRKRSARRFATASYGALRRAAVIILAVVITLSVLAVSVEAFRVRAMNFFIEIQNEFISVQLTPKNPDGLKKYAEHSPEAEEDIYTGKTPLLK